MKARSLALKAIYEPSGKPPLIKWPSRENEQLRHEARKAGDQAENRHHRLIESYQLKTKLIF